jgi:carbon storage regulator CsrA
LNIRKNQIYLDVNISESLTINIHESASLRDGKTIKVIRIDKDKVRLGIEAPKDITINREEVFKEDQVGKVLPSNSGVIDHTKE